MTTQDPKSGRFVKGQSGNPGGRQKSELSITALIDDAVSVNDWRTIFNHLKTKALRGNVKAIEMLMDRRFGKAIQQTQLTGADGGPVQITRVEMVLPPEDMDDSAI